MGEKRTLTVLSSIVAPSNLWPFKLSFIKIKMYLFSHIYHISSAIQIQSIPVFMRKKALKIHFVKFLGNK